MSACLPTIRPVLQYVFSKLPFRESLRSGSRRLDYESRSAREAYHLAQRERNVFRPFPDPACHVHRPEAIKIKHISVTNRQIDPESGNLLTHDSAVWDGAGDWVRLGNIACSQRESHDLTPSVG